MLRLNKNGFSIYEALIAIVFALIIIGVGYILIHKNTKVSVISQHSSSSTKVSNSSSYKILSLATVESKTAECNQSVSYGSSGQPIPLQCSNGELNVTAWNSLATIEPKVMTLGYSPTIAQVQSAICSDANAANADSSAATSNSIEEEVYQISALYYGWSFSSDPSVVLSNGTC